MMEGFVGAILGALIGGVLTYLATMRAARFTMEKTTSLDRQRREEERAEIRQQLAGQLLAEIKDNISILEKPKLDWGCAILVHEIWDTAKGQILFQTAEIAERVRQAYTEVYLYNALVRAATVDRATFELIRNLPVVEPRARVARAALEQAARAIEGAPMPA